MSKTENLTFIDKETTISKDFLQFLAKGEENVTLTVKGVSKNKVSVGTEEYSTDIELIDGLVYGDKLTIAVNSGKIVSETLAKRVNSKSKSTKGNSCPLGTRLKF